MSHTDRCPDRYDARREGERAHDRGYGSFRNPYDGYGPDRCDEAASAWRSGWYEKEREQEEREAQAAHERASRRQIDEEADYYMDRAEREDYELREAARYAEQEYSESEPEPDSPTPSVPPQQEQG
jgi:hypothetical protein